MVNGRYLTGKLKNNRLFPQNIPHLHSEEVSLLNWKFSSSYESGGTMGLDYMGAPKAHSASSAL